MAITLTEAPFFIVGQERSGTTLLMVMLGCHPRIAVSEVSSRDGRFQVNPESLQSGQSRKFGGAEHT